MGRAAAAAAPADPKAVMAARRAAYREEQGLPDVKWSCFAEQRKHEDFAAVRSRRLEVLWWFPFVDVTRGHLTSMRVVSFFILRLFGTHRLPHRSNLRKNKRPSRRRARSPTGR